MHITDLVRPLSQQLVTGLHLGARIQPRVIDVGWVPSFFTSFTSLVALGLIRWGTTTSWDWSFLIDQSSVSPRHQPFLRHLELDLRHWMEWDDNALFGVLDAYGSTLATLALSLTVLHPVQQVVRSIFACQQLESLALDMRSRESWTFSIDAPSALPLSHSLRTLHLGVTEMTEAQAVVLISACPALQSLSLTNNQNLSLALLPGIGQACRHLRRLTMKAVSLSLFQSGLEGLLTTPAARLVSSESGPLFPQLINLTLQAEQYAKLLTQSDPMGQLIDVEPPVYSMPVLVRLVSLLSSYPLRSLCLNLTFASQQELRVFAPLFHLEKLQVEGPCAVPGHFLRHRDITRHDVERDLMLRSISFLRNEQDNSWKWSEKYVFQEERTFRDADGQCMNGREAFFASLERAGTGGTTSCTIN